MKTQDQLKEIMADLVDVMQSYQCTTNEIEVILNSLKGGLEQVKQIQRAEQELECTSPTIH